MRAARSRLGVARKLPAAPTVARISVTVRTDRHAVDRYFVLVTGRLSRGDLRRLERACGKAMESPRPPLEVCIADAADIDPAVLFFLERLRARGALVTGPGFPVEG